MSSGTTRLRILAVCAVLIVSGLAIAGAQSTIRFETHVILFSAPAESGQNDSYTGIISNFIRAALANRGVPAAIIKTEAELSAFGEMAAAEDVAGLAELTRDSGGDFLLITQYELGPGRIELQFICLDANTGVVVTSGEETAKPLLLDVALDREVEVVVSGLLLRGSLVPVAQTTPPTESEPDESEPETAQTEEETPATQVSTIAAVPHVTPVAPVRGKNGLFVSPTFGLFQSLGTAGDYFRQGIMPALSVHYGLALRGGRLSPGVLIGTIYFETADEVAQSKSFLSPFALDIRYTTASNGIMDFVIFLSGGGALFSVDVEQTGFVSKVIPYAGGGMGFMFFQMERFSLFLDVSLGAYFENPDPIIGYVVGIGVQLSGLSEQ